MGCPGVIKEFRYCFRKPEHSSTLGTFRPLTSMKSDLCKVQCLDFSESSFVVLSELN